MKLARYLVVYAVLAAVGLAAGWLASRSGNAPQSVRENRAAAIPTGGDSVSFTIRGSVDDLTLARPSTLNLSVTNPHPWPITILTITVVPDDASSTCPAAGNIRIGSYDSSTFGAPSYRIDGRQALTVALSVIVINDSTQRQDACKNVKFRLHYYGTATTG